MPGRPEGTSIDESAPFDPSNEAGEYDRTKAEASLAVLAEVSRGLDAVIVCPTGIIGPYYVKGGSPMLGLIKRWMTPGPHVAVDGHFDFVDVRDVAVGMVLAAERGMRGQAYILSGAACSHHGCPAHGSPGSGDQGGGLTALPPWRFLPPSLQPCIHESGGHRSGLRAMRC